VLSHFRLPKNYPVLGAFIESLKGCKSKGKIRFNRKKLSI
jgi:hypothetical protein